MSKHLLFLFLILITSCKSKKEEAQPEAEKLFQTSQYLEVNGVDPNLLSLDIYYASDIDNKKPVVIFVHGGGWCIGDKTTNILDKAKLFQSLGYVFVSINYRLSPFPYALNNPDRIKFPTHSNDVAKAIKWIFKEISNFGGNSQKLALIGHSAGAHLVALTGTNEQFLSQEGLSLANIKGIAVIDTKGYDVGDHVLNGNIDNMELYINAFGKNADLNQEASPIFQVESSKAHPKFFIAKRGSLARIAAADEFVQTLSSNGVEVAEVNGSVYDHSGINKAIGAEGETIITPPLSMFLAECFK